MLADVVKKYKESEAKQIEISQALQREQATQKQILKDYKQAIYKSIWFWSSGESDVDFPDVAKVFYLNGKSDIYNLDVAIASKSEIGYFLRKIWVNDLHDDQFFDMAYDNFILGSEAQLAH